MVSIGIPWSQLVGCAGSCDHEPLHPGDNRKGQQQAIAPPWGIYLRCQDRVLQGLGVAECGSLTQPTANMTNHGRTVSAEHDVSPSSRKVPDM